VARGVVWLHPDGTWTPARCGASNRCWYCARLMAIENLVVLKLDARDNCAPTVGMTLTTVEAKTTPKALRAGIEKVTKALRRRWPNVEYCGFVEWTTGLAPGSGGHRRVHVHLLLKFLPVDACEQAEQIVRRVWKERTGAHRVEVRELRVAGGATAYLANHHGKRAQGPPVGWSGKRLRPSKGYFGAAGQVGKLRERARALLAEERLYRAVEAELEDVFIGSGLAVEDVDLVQLDNGDVVGRRTVTVFAGELWDEMAFDRYSHEVQRLQERTPLLVRVRHVDRVDPLTGEVHREVAEFYGPKHPTAAVAKLEP
jgi:hypothetical protein